MNNKNSQQGITIIQILVMFGIICVIVLFFVFLLSSERKKTRDYIRVSNVKQMQAGLEMFYSQNGSYPAVSAGPAVGGSAHNWLPDLSDQGILTNFAAFISQDLVAPLPADSKICESIRVCNEDTASTLNDFCYIAYPPECSASGNVKCNAYTFDFCTAFGVGGLKGGAHQITNNEIRQ